jgi:hypothetical protein
MIDAMWDEFRQMIMPFEEDEQRLRYAKLMFVGGAGKTVDVVTTLAVASDQEQAKQVFDDLREELLNWQHGDFPV